MVSESRSAVFWLSASASTRTTGSVPDGRTRIRPLPSSSAFRRASSCSSAIVKVFVRTWTPYWRTFPLVTGPPLNLLEVPQPPTVVDLSTI